MRLIVLFLFMHFTLINYAQVSSITALPQEASGFLVLNQNSFPDVTIWTIDISEKKIIGSDIVYTSVYSAELLGVNYYNVPNVYWQNTIKPYFIRVIGYGNDHTILTDSDYQIISANEPEFENLCNWTCVSDYYAYTISLDANTNGGSHVLTLNSAYSSINSNGIAIPYYRYVNYNPEWLTFCNSTNPPFAWYDCDENFDGINQKYLYNVQLSDNVLDVDGFPLTGTVVGIRKSRGPWYLTPMQTSVLIGGQSACQLDLEGAIAELNTYNVINVGNVPELECIGNAEAEVDEAELESGIEMIACAEALLNFVATAIPNSNVYQFALTLVDCYDAAVDEEVVGGIWPGNLDNISIYPLDHTAEVKILNTTDLFSANGEFIGPNFTTEPGLYTFGLTFKDKSYLPLIKELKTTMNSTIALADFVEVIPFPNPFTSNQYEVNISANAKVKFQYIVTELNGNELYSKNFVIQQGHSTTHIIKLKNNLLPGTYINRLVFEDNSVKSFSVQKI